MNNATREQIFDRMRSALGQGFDTHPAPENLPELKLDKKGKINRLKQLMEAVRTEVHVVSPEGFPDALREIFQKKQVKNLLYAPETPIGAQLETEFDSVQLELVAYTQEVENFKEDLFGIDAGITSTKGGIAETGAIILWPNEKEPRLMSLVPPIHIAVLEADTIYNSLTEVMAAQSWVEGMPTNALLVSGPSKTADIEFQLVFGVHGPKELVVFIID